MKHLLLSKKCLLLWCMLTTTPALAGTLTTAIPKFIRSDFFGYASMALAGYFQGKAQPGAAPVRMGNSPRGKLSKAELSKAAQAWFAAGVVSFSLRRWQAYKKKQETTIVIIKKGEASVLKGARSEKEGDSQEPIITVSTPKKADVATDVASVASQKALRDADSKV